MAKLYTNICKICKESYRGRGKYYCSRTCTLSDKERLIKQSYSLKIFANENGVWNKGKSYHKKVSRKVSKNCLYCNNVFDSYPSEKQKFCGNICQHKGRDYIPYNKGRRSPRLTCKCGSGKSLQAMLCFNCYQRTDAPKMNGLKGRIMLQNRKGPTSIENIVYEYLVLKGILFEKQKLINDKFLVDAYIPSLNLIIEADGKYWHTLPKTMKKDKAENAYLTKCGFNLIRLGEDEINDGSFKERMVV